MKYYFVLGNNAALSIAELLSIFSKLKLKTNNLKFVNNELMLIDIDNKFVANELIALLGGTIKIGKILCCLNSYKNEHIISDILKELKLPENKFFYGFSTYGKSFINIKILALELKKVLRAKNISSRWVTSKQKNLSSVVIEQNKLLRRGAEIVLINDGNNKFLGRTLAVQLFKELSKRDYGRPARDDHSGMLPPKLAQIMINLAEAKLNDMLIDPFCGSGTILSEAMVMGYKNLIGLDISKKAIADTEANISWIKKHYPDIKTQYSLIRSDVNILSKKLKPNSVAAIVTEPYLGPQRGAIDISKTINQLEQLYSHALTQFYQVLKSNGKIVMVWPVFRQRKKIFFLKPAYAGYKQYKPLEKESIVKPYLSKRGTIIYGRSNQRIWREIIILAKTSI